MKVRSLFLILLIVSLFTTVDGIAQTGAGKGKGRLRGIITDQDGNPLNGVTIRFTNERLEATFDLQSNEKGEWIAAGVAGGNWNIDFSKEGYESKQISYPIQQLGYNKPVVLSLQKMVKVAAPGPGAQPSGQPADPSRVLIIEGSTLADQKDYAGAIAKYEQAMQLKPELFTLWGEIGNLYTQMGDSAKALDAYRKLVEKDPANTDARLAAVDILFGNKDLDGARKMLEGLDFAAVTNANALYNVGVHFYNAQDGKEAIRYWEKVIEIDPAMVDAYFQLGNAYYSVKNVEKSKTMYQKVIEIEPESENAKMAKEMLDTIK